MPNPIERREATTVSHANSRITQLGSSLKQNKALDARYYTKNSIDTRRDVADIGDALEQRSALKRDLKTRLGDWNTSPASKAHADAMLAKIRTAEHRERDDQITGRTARPTTRELGSDRHGILRVKY